MQGTVVGVLRGGPSHKHEISLRSGHAVLNALPREKYTVRDIFIDREGTWHERGLITSPAVVLPSIDVAVIALHGIYGEDGEVQKVLERYGIPYAGSDSFASFVSIHKVLAKEKARSLGFLVPRYTFIETEEGVDPIIHEVIRTYPQPVVVKSPRWGSSVGTTLPAGYLPVHQAVTGLFNEGAGGALIEEYIRGTHASVSVVENIRGEYLYTLPAVETVPSRYESVASLVAPGRFSKQIMGELQEQAKRIHQELGLRHYSHSSFIVSPKGIYYLETSSLPELTAESPMPKSLAAVGITFTQFLEHIIALALESRKR